MARRGTLLIGASVAASTLLLAIPLPALASGYFFYRVVIWGTPGEQPPRLEQDPAGRGLMLLFPGAAPDTGWDPVPARRLEMQGGAFTAGEPVSILRPRDPDPNWESAALEGSMDLNQDGLAEVVKARTVLIPDARDSMGGMQRAILEVKERDLVLFSDRIEGPSGGPVRVHGITATDFTGEGYADLVVWLEASDRTGAAFYSQHPLRYAGSATLRIDGSSSAFKCDAYGIFDLAASPKDFFGRIPSSARADRPACADQKGVEPDGMAHCIYQFSSPYQGWIKAFEVAFVPARSLNRFEFYFPSGGAALTPQQALDFLIPVFGGDYRTSSSGSRSPKQATRWQWKGKRSTATLEASERSGRMECVSLQLERR